MRSAENLDLIATMARLLIFGRSGNGLFTAAGSHNNLVIDSDSLGTLQLFSSGAANADWELAQFNRQLGRG